MSVERISYFYVLIAALLWGSVPAVAKLLLKNLNNLQVLLYSSLIASMSLFVIVMIQGKLPEIKNYKIKDYFTFAYMGSIGIFLYFIFLYAGLTFAPAQEAFIVNYTWPIWVIIFATIFLKEKLGIKKVIAVLLGFIGVYLVVTKGQIFSFSIISLKGDLFALAGAVCYGIFSVLGKKQNYDRFISMFFYFSFAFVLTLVSTIIFSNIPPISLYELGGLIWLGIFTSALAHVLWFLALKHGDIAKMSNMIFLTPFLALIYIYFLVGEEILISSIIGLFLIVFGIIIQSYNKKTITPAP